MVLEGKKKQADAVATIQRSERRARCYKKFHIFTKTPRTPGGLTHIIHTDINRHQTRIQQPDQLEDILFNRNQKHFSQSDGTPFTRPPLNNQLNFSGVSPFGESVLDGNAFTNNIPDSARAILAELKRVRPPLLYHMPFHSMITGLSKWREQTTTSPSNKHLGIYKSLIQYYKLDLQQKNTHYKDPNEHHCAHGT
jgi:hypothetical protein